MMEKEESFQQTVLGSFTSIYRKMSLDPYLIPNAKANPEWIIDLGIKHKLYKKKKKKHKL